MIYLRAGLLARPSPTRLPARLRRTVATAWDIPGLTVAGQLPLLTEFPIILRHERRHP